MKITSLAIMVLFLISCHTNEEIIPDNLNLLTGTWQFVEMTSANQVTGNYFRKFSYSGTGENMQTDTVFFGKPAFQFFTGTPFNSFVIGKDKVRKLEGFWEGTVKRDSIRIYPAATIPMAGDTTINGRRYSFIQLMPSSFRIKELSQTKLILQAGTEELQLVRQ